MPCSSAPGKRLPSFSASRCFLLVLCLALAAMPLKPAQAEDAVTVLYATLAPSGDDWLLDAALNVRLNKTQEEGLKKGIPLNFVTEFKLQRVRAWWFNEDVAVASRTGRLNYSTLTRRYQLETAEGFRAYDTLPEALAELGRIENWAIVPGKSLKTGNAYKLALRMRLDVGQLSKPLQINALASGKWEVESDWHEWEVTP
jgi:hypothetical protein